MSGIHLEQTEGFLKMDQSMRKMAIDFKEGKDSLTDQLRDISLGQAKQTEQIIQHIDKNRQKQRDEVQQDKEKLLQKEFIDSLMFPEITTREENIKSSHEKTFQWIFGRFAADQKPWDNLVEWLETGSGTYWINGKAGSGKSTLMRFICQDVRTDEALAFWAEDRDVLRPSFYFWAAG